jgi:hypothetical protein
MKHLLALRLVLLTLALAACTSQPTATPAATQPVAGAVTDTPGAAGEAPSATPVASLTPPPLPETATAEPPTATPTEAILPTATVPPTPDPNQNVGEVVFEDQLDGSGQWFWSYDDEAATFGVSATEKGVVATAKKSGTWRYSTSNDVVNVGDQQVRLNATLNTCGGGDSYGLMFRGQTEAGTSNYNLYIFEVSCDGAARLSLLKGSNFTALTNWAPFPAIKIGPGEVNDLMVWAGKDELRFYVNEQYLFTVNDATLLAGFYGLFLYDRLNGNMSVTYRNLVAKGVTLP